MNQLLANKIDKVTSAMKLHHVKNAYAFGSICTDSFNDSSDVDILVSFEEMQPADYADNYFSLLYKLQEIFSREVDLITEKSLKNKYFINVINKSKIPLYE